VPLTLDAHAIDQSTYVVVASFTDEDGAAVAPNTITWTLMDEAGNVINSRSAVVVAAPASSINIVLSGDDLDPAESKHRVIRIDATYDSTLGNDLPLIETANFIIDDLLEPLAAP
jgi:hypothetical protein